MAENVNYKVTSLVTNSSFEKPTQWKLVKCVDTHEEIQNE